MPQSVPTKTHISETMIRFLRIWGVEDLASNITIAYSPRLRSSLGLTRVATKGIKLNLLLEKSNIDLFDEVLCHELAHIAVHEIYGPEALPHGQEWSELMRNAGYVRKKGDRFIFLARETPINKSVPFFCLFLVTRFNLASSAVIGENQTYNKKDLKNMGLVTKHYIDTMAQPSLSPEQTKLETESSNASDVKLGAAGWLGHSG